MFVLYFLKCQLQALSEIFALKTHVSIKRKVIPHPHFPLRKVTAEPISPRPHALSTVALCTRLTHFHSGGSPLGLLANQVDLFIFTFHVFLCNIVHPVRTSCRKQQRLRVVLRTWQERPPISDITADSNLRSDLKKSIEFSQFDSLSLIKPIQISFFRRLLVQILLVQGSTNPKPSHLFQNEDHKGFA